MPIETLKRILLLSALTFFAVGAGAQIARGQLLKSAFIVAIPLLIGIGGLMLTRPQYLGFFLVFLLFSNLDVLISHSLQAHAAVIWLVLCFAYIGLIVVTWQQRTPIAAPIRLLGIFFIVAMCTSAVLPTVDNDAISQWMQIVGYAFAATLVTYLVLCTPERMRLAAIGITWIGFGLAIINIIEFMDRSLISLSNVPGRSAGLMINANPSAAAILACFILSYMTPQRFMLPVRVIMFAGIYTTFSRSTLVLFFIFLVYNELIVEKLNIQRFVITALLFLSVVGFLSYSAFFVDQSANKQVKMSYRRIVDAKQGKFDDSSTNHRRKVVTINFERFMNKPIFGNGLGAASTINSPHNQFLLVMAEHGAVGIVIWLAFLVTLFGRLYRLQRGESRRVLLSLFWFMILNMFFTHNMYHIRFYMILFAMLCAGGEIYPKRVPLPSTEAVVRRLPLPLPIRRTV